MTLTPAYLWHLLSMVCIFLPVATGYNLIFGKGKIFHFGGTGVAIVAAYSLILVWQATGSLAAALLASIVATSLLSTALAWLSFRLEPDGLGIMTIAVHLGLLAVVLQWSGLTRGALGIPRIPRFPLMETPSGFGTVALLLSVLWIAFLWWFSRSAVGRQLEALAEQEWYAKALGVNRTRVHLLAFIIGGLGTVLSGALYPQYVRLLHPNDYRFDGFMFILMLVVAGKPGSVLGVTLSTMLLVLLKETLRFLPLPGSVRAPMLLVLFGAILLGAVWWRRDTLFPGKRTV